MRYRKNYLTKVVFRVDFPAIHALQGNEKPEFSTLISADYPNYKASETREVRLLIADGGSEIDNQPTGFVWEHSSENKKCVVSVSPDFFSISYDEFESFDTFKCEVVKLFSMFKEQYPLVDLNRIGLRYVNEIVLSEGAPLEWGNLINDDLITALKAELHSDMKLVRSMHQLHALQDDITILFNYGVANSEYPNPVARREFILDIDTFVHRGEANEALRRFEDLNNVAERIFEDSIKDGLREKMELINE